MQRKVGYAPGTLYHIWHGDIAKRQYFSRVKEFNTKATQITNRDDNGFYVTDDSTDDTYMLNYFNQREVLPDITTTDPTFEFGGGHSGGGGASGSFADTDNVDTANEPNFS